MLELQRLMSSLDAQLRGDEQDGGGAPGFRLLLSLPHAALPALPASVRQRSLVVLLQPPRLPATWAHGAMQLLAHPLMSYLGFYDKVLMVLRSYRCCYLVFAGSPLANGSTPRRASYLL